MKIKLSIKKDLQLQPEILNEKIEKYLKNNSYRIIEKGSGFIIFIDDEYSYRKRLRSDYHNRISEGKFEFNSLGNKTFVKLIYLTPVSYPIFIMMLFVVAGIYIQSFIPIFFSFAITLPILLKIYNLNENVFNEILRSPHETEIK